jgi:hypothetical protein
MPSLVKVCRTASFVLVPTLALFQFRLPGLAAIPVRLPIPDREICVIRGRLGNDSVAAAAFIERLREAMQKEGRRRSVSVRG